jgi:xanthine dehydrogenase accessory factor
VIADPLSEQVSQLMSEREPFVLATVVRARRPTSVRAGDRAVVRRDGTIDGFVGGVCAESSVRLHSLRAMETGEPLLLALVPDDAAGAGAGEVADGAVVEHNPCLSGGALEIFLEPHLPPPRIIVVGGSPIALALERIAGASGYDCLRSDPDGLGSLDHAAAVIVCTHGNREDAVLAHALRAGVPYVALVASPRRGRTVTAELDVADELRARLHTPAGLDIGARTPDEIAISILAEVIAEQHSHADVLEGSGGVGQTGGAAAGGMGAGGAGGGGAGGAGGGAGGAGGASAAGAPAAVATATDPVCGMTVAISPASPQLTVDGETLYFCGPGCRDAYGREHAGR